MYLACVYLFLGCQTEQVIVLFIVNVFFWDIESFGKRGGNYVC